MESMKYYCIENNELVSVMDYVPSVPESVSMVAVSEDDHDSIETRHTHYFDIESLSVRPRPDHELRDMYNEKEVQRNRQFLDDTDWKVLRHLRETTLDIQTTLSQDEYIYMEHQRNQAVNTIRSLTK